MTYKAWFDEHAIKHKIIVDELLAKEFTQEQIIEYFEFDNMVKNEPNFCLLYAEKKKCHDLEYLSCYLCACPHFRFNDEGIEKVEDKIKYSLCDIDSKFGNAAVYGDKIHQDCSACTIPHTKKYVQKHFDLDWKKIMKESIL